MKGKDIGRLLVLAGLAGVVIPIMVMMLGCDERTQAMLIGVMISGSILLGSGSISLAIADKE